MGLKQKIHLTKEKKDCRLKSAGLRELGPILRVHRTSGRKMEGETRKNDVGVNVAQALSEGPAETEKGKEKGIGEKKIMKPSHGGIGEQDREGEGRGLTIETKGKVKAHL